MSKVSYAVCCVCKEQVKRVRYLNGLSIPKTDQFYFKAPEFIEQLMSFQEPITHGYCPKCFEIEKKKI